VFVQYYEKQNKALFFSKKERVSSFTSDTLSAQTNPIFLTTSVTSESVG
jgi:hypothetical protein